MADHNYLANLIWQIDKMALAEKAVRILFSFGSSGF